MKLWKILVSVISAAVIITAAASAETINTIEQAEQTALLNNLEYKSAVLEVLKAEHALEGIIKLDSSSISLSGSYGQKNTDNTDAAEASADDSGFGWQASASLPVIEQLSLGASVDEDFTGTFSISLNPLSHSGSTEETRLAYESKLAAAEDKATEISDAAVAGYLDWAAAVSDYDVKLDTADVKQILYEDEKVRFEKGESTLDDVREAFTAWSESRTSANDALSKLQTAEAELYSILNIDSAVVNLELPAEADLFNNIETMQNEINSAELAINGSYAVYSAETAAQSLELQLKNTWLFEPDLSISGNLSISPSNLQPTFSATAAVSFGLDDWNAEERAELAAELEISRRQAVQTINAEQLSLKQAVTAAETAAINYEAAVIELEQAEELLDEADFLHELGEYSAAELEETRLEYEQIKNNLFSAAASHYAALRALAAYI